MTKDMRLVSYHGCNGDHSDLINNPQGLNGWLRDPAHAYGYLDDQYRVRGNDRVLSHMQEGWLDQMSGVHWPVMPPWRKQVWQAAMAVATEANPDLEIIAYGSGNIGIGGATSQLMVPYRQFNMAIPSDKAALRAQVSPFRYAGGDGWCLDNAGGTAPETIQGALPTCAYLKKTLKLKPYVEAFPVNPDHTLDRATMNQVASVALLPFVRFHMKYAEPIKPWAVGTLACEAIVLVQPGSNWVNGVWTEMSGWPPPAWAFPTLAELTELVARGFCLAPLGGSLPYTSPDWNFDPMARAAYDAYGIPWK